MTTIDLSTPPAPAPSLLEGLPRRVALTLPELCLVAELAGGAPLPFDEVSRADATTMESRLGESRGSADASARERTLTSFHEPRESLSRRGLLHDGELDASIAGAIGLLATPELALQVDVAVAGVQAISWQRSGDGAVATLGTVDGLVFELAWFGVDQWAGELARVARLPEEVTLSASQVPGRLSAPYELADAVGEAIRSHRDDLVPVLAAQHSGQVEVDEQTAPDAESAEALRALHRETQGRLRVLATSVTETGTAPVGVVSWLLVQDGWRAVCSRAGENGARLEVTRVDPADLATELAPVISEVTA